MVLGGLFVVWFFSMASTKEELIYSQTKVFNTNIKVNILFFDLSISNQYTDFSGIV